MLEKQGGGERKKRKKENRCNDYVVILDGNIQENHETRSNIKISNTLFFTSLHTSYRRYFNTRNPRSRRRLSSLFYTYIYIIKIRGNDELISIDREVDRWIRRSGLVQDLANALSRADIDPTSAFGMHRAII